MITLFAYLMVGGILLFVILNDFDFAEDLGILSSFAERVVFIWAWPAFMFVIFLFRYCRDESDPVHPKI